jgi:ABC-type nitrate/sulfonate/bicarbonate transport system permease component
VIRRGLPTIAAFCLWEVAARWGLLNVNLLPPPSRVLSALADWGRGSLLVDIAASGLRVAAGFGVGAVCGLAVGVAAALSETFRTAVAPVAEVFRPIPPIAWIPLAVLWFGIGSPAAVFIVAIGAFFPVMTATVVGFATVDRTCVDTAKCLGAGPRLLVTDILLPAALPTIIGGLRIAVGMAWMGVIAAELIGAQSGLGYMIQLNRVLLRTEHVIAGMLVIGVVGLSAAKAMTLAERRLLPWQDIRPAAEEDNGTNAPSSRAIDESIDEDIR